MGIFLVFTFLVFPILLGALSHFCTTDSSYHRKQKPKQNLQQENNLTHKASKPLILPHKSLPRLIIEAKALRRRMAMDEKQSATKKMTRKLSLQKIDVEEAQQKAQDQSRTPSPQSPRKSPLPSPSLKKSPSGKMNCLCAPTTHAGSFRCRLHRNSSSFRRLSPRSGLNELDAKSSLTAAPLETA